MTKIGRVVAKVERKRREQKAKKESKEIKKLGLARNKALAEAKKATEIAKAREELRQAKLAKASAITRRDADKIKKRKERKAKARGFISDTIKSAKSLGISLAGKPKKKRKKRRM